MTHRNRCRFESCTCVIGASWLPGSRIYDPDTSPGRRLNKARGVSRGITDSEQSRLTDCSRPRVLALRASIKPVSWIHSGLLSNPFTLAGPKPQHRYIWLRHGDTFHRFYAHSVGAAFIVLSPLSLASSRIPNSGNRRSSETHSLLARLAYCTLGGRTFNHGFTG